MFVETSRHGFQLELSRAGLVQFAERLVFPNHSRRYYAGSGPVFARVTSVRRVGRAPAVRDHVSFDGRDSRDARLRFGTRTDHAGVANFADASDLSADAELLHLESDYPRDQRRVGQLGKTGAHRERSRSRVAVDLAMREFFRVATFAVAITALVACQKKTATTHPHIDPNGPVEVVIPEHGAYTGAFIDFGD